MELQRVIHSLSVYGIDITQRLVLIPPVVSASHASIDESADPDTQFVICGSSLAVVTLSKRRFNLCSCSRSHPVDRLHTFALHLADNGMYVLEGQRSSKHKVRQFREHYSFAGVSEQERWITAIRAASNQPRLLVVGGSTVSPNIASSDDYMVRSERALPLAPDNSPAPGSVVEPPIDEVTVGTDAHKSQRTSDSEPSDESDPPEPVTSDAGPGPSPLPSVASAGPRYSAAGTLAQDQARSLADQQLELASDVTMQTLMQALHQYELWSGRLPAIDTASDATALSRRQKHCRYVYHEIITTEADFVKHLCVVVHDYMAPLARRSHGGRGAPTPRPDAGSSQRSVNEPLERGGGGEEPSSRAQRWGILGDGGGRASSTALLSQVRLPDRTFQQIFGSIAVLLPVNMELLRRMVHGFEDRGEAGQAEVVAQVFLKLAPFMRLYGEYCRNYYSAVKALQQELGENKGFRGFAAAVREEVQECDNLDLQSLLIKPVQRICKYPLLLRDLMKHLPEDDPALSSMQRALTMVETIARDVNAYIQQQELNSQLLKVCAAFGQWGSDILSPTRRIVAEWPDLRVSGIRSSDYSNPKEYHAFLFNDIMIFGRSKSKAFRRRTASISLTSKAVTSQHGSAEHQRDDDSGTGNVKLKLAGLVYLHELRLPQEWVGAGPTSPRRPATAAGTGDGETRAAAGTAGSDGKGTARRRKVPPPALPNMRPSTANGSNRVNEAAALTAADFGDGLTVAFMVLRRANTLTGSMGTSDRKLVASTAAPTAGQTGVEKLTMHFGSEVAKRQFVGVLLPTLNADRQLRVNLARRQLREPGRTRAWKKQTRLPSNMLSSLQAVLVRVDGEVDQQPSAAGTLPQTNDHHVGLEDDLLLDDVGSP